MRTKVEDIEVVGQVITRLEGQADFLMTHFGNLPNWHIQVAAAKLAEVLRHLTEWKKEHGTQD